MTLLYTLPEKLNWLKTTLHFFRKHFLSIIGLGSFAAFGRVIQLGGFGEIAGWANIFLEVIIEFSRILLFLYVLGLGNIRNGLLRTRRIFVSKGNRSYQWTKAFQNIRKQWVAILLNMIGFLFIAWILNYMIDLLAYKTCLYLTLKRDGVLHASSSEWTILLFFKNFSVIPFTLVFNALFILWITGKLHHHRITYAG